MTVTRLPTKFGQGHSDAIGFFQDEVLPRLIENKIVCLVLRGVCEDGDELHYTMVDSSGERAHNLRMVGQICEAKALVLKDLASD